MLLNKPSQNLISAVSEKLKLSGEELEKSCLKGNMKINDQN